VEGEPHQEARADLEASAGWRAGSIRREGDARVRTATSGDAEWSDELSEAEPSAPHGGRWGFRAWLRRHGREDSER
jgi:hypothetical protein